MKANTFFSFFFCVVLCSCSYVFGMLGRDSTSFFGILGSDSTSVLDMLESDNTSEDQQSCEVVEENTQKLEDLWWRIEDLGLPLELNIFKDKFSLLQIADFLNTIEEWWKSYGWKWQRSGSKRSASSLRRTFEKKYRNVLYRDFPESLECVICGKSFKLYATCINHILFEHFKIKEL